MNDSSISYIFKAIHALIKSVEDTEAVPARHDNRY